MQHVCGHCSSAFEISPQEDALRAKISPRVGGVRLDIQPPTLCPDCRQQRRLLWRNERSLYRRTCDSCKKATISIYPAESPFPVYCTECWWSDRWDPLSFGQPFDFSRPFFEQFRSLQVRVPRLALNVVSNENCEYVNLGGYNKSCYLVFAMEYNEDCMYGTEVVKCTGCVDMLNCFESRYCYEVTDVEKCHSLSFSKDCSNCSDSFFLSDCKGCSDCFGCFGLRNKKHCIFNEQHTKEEYARKLKELNTGNVRTLQAARDAFEKRAAHQQIHQYVDGNGNENVTGDHIVHCRNCIECYDSADLEDCGHLIFSFKSKDCYDGHVVVDRCELCYGTISTINQYNTQFTFVSFYSKNSQYLDHCQHCEDCFGCSGLKRKRFCIFKVQYTEQEYHALRTKIIEHMKETPLRSSGASGGQACEWGQPLPPELSPFGYNETVAQEYFPLTEADVTALGWKWHTDTESETSAYQGPCFPIPQNIDETTDEIVQKILVCERSGRPFKIIPQELTLYREHHLPLPRLCFEERHLDRVRNRNPRRLWERTCMKCGKEMQATYAPERPETVYCERCYLREVY